MTVGRLMAGLIGLQQWERATHDPSSRKSLLTKTDQCTSTRQCHGIEGTTVKDTNLVKYLQQEV